MKTHLEPEVQRSGNVARKHLHVRVSVKKNLSGGVFIRFCSQVLGYRFCLDVPYRFSRNNKNSMCMKHSCIGPCVKIPLSQALKEGTLEQQPHDCGKPYTCDTKVDHPWDFVTLKGGVFPLPTVVKGPRCSRCCFSPDTKAPNTV